MKSLLQTPEWAEFKTNEGWMAHDVDGVSILEKKLPLGKSFLYAPEMSYETIFGHSERIKESLANASFSNKLRDSSPSAQNDNFNIFLAKLQKICKENKVIFFRLEILDEFDDKIIQVLKQNGFIKSFEQIQPEWRQIIDISKSEEEILAQMKSKGRYNIKVSQKNGVVVEKIDPSTPLGVNDFYKIFRQTAKRDGFMTRPKQYFEKLIQIFAPSEVVEVWQAKYNNIVVAAEIVTFYDGTASYLYGASANEYRNLMAPYLLHWQVIKRAKEKGCKVYDLLAIAPPDIENHKYAGITRFKEQFGGRKVHLVGSYDLVYKPMWYKMFKIAEKYRRR